MTPSTVRHDLEATMERLPADVRGSLDLRSPLTVVRAGDAGRGSGLGLAVAEPAAGTRRSTPEPEV